MARHLDRIFAADPSLGSGQGRTVLVVDPDRTARTVIVNLLRPEGYRVLEAERADKALFLALEKSVDAFLLAQTPSGLAAADFCRRIRALARYRQAPIISILMPFDEAAVSAAFAAGADDFLTRPVNAQTLRTRLAGRLQRAQDTPAAKSELTGLASFLTPRLRYPDEGGSRGAGQSQDTGEVCVLAVRLSLPGASGESALRLVARSLGAQVDSVYRHGGYIARLEADGLRAVFESPDRLECAVACLQELRRRLLASRSAGSEGDLQWQASLSEGPLCSPAATDDRAAPGDPLDAAAKLCDQAHSMEILIPQALHARLGPAAAGLVTRAVPASGARPPRRQQQGGDPPPARPRAA
jgi:DNA-binding response OmpR family regulator